MEWGEYLPEPAPDRLTPRERLSHKLRDGAYRARQLGQRSSCGLTEVLPLMEIDTCYYCGSELGNYYELDHKQPLTRGGEHVASNLAKACGYCNHHKSDKTEDEYLIYLAGGFSEIQQPLVERIDP